MYSLAFKKKAGQLFDIEIILPVAVVVVVPINADKINLGIIRQGPKASGLGNLTRYYALTHNIF